MSSESLAVARGKTSSRCWIVWVCFLAGCTAKATPATIARSERAVDEGWAALQTEHYEEAERLFTEALSGAFSSPDLVEGVLLGRAEARLALDKLDAAEEDLQTLEEGAGQMDRVWRLRGLLAQKSGDADAAREAFRKAKALNP